MKRLIEKLEDEYLRSLDKRIKRKIKFLKLERIYRKTNLTYKQERKKHFFEEESRQKNFDWSADYFPAPYYREILEEILDYGECHKLSEFLLNKIKESTNLEKLFARYLIDGKCLKNCPENNLFLEYLKDKVNPEEVFRYFKNLEAYYHSKNVKNPEWLLKYFPNLEI